MLLTKQILENHGACGEGMYWYISNDEPASVEETIEKLLAPKAKLLALNEHEKFVWSKRFDWSNWLLSHVLPVDDKIRYAIFAAELVLDIFEKEFPEDKRPRNAIEAAREYLSNKDDVVADEVNEAADRAARAVCVTVARVVGRVGHASACAAACAARDAARAACDAARAACVTDEDYAVTCAVVNAVYAAARDAARASRETDEAYVVTYTKIINYGLSLIEKCDDRCCETQD